MKWLAGLVLLVGAGLGVAMAGGLDAAGQRAGDWLVKGLRAVSELAPVTPPERPGAPSTPGAPAASARATEPSRPAAAPAPITAPVQPAPHIERRLDQGPQEQVSDADRDRLARLIDQGLTR